MEEKKWEEKILAYSLDNAIKHDGKAQEGSILGHLFKEGLDKDAIPEIMPLIKKIVKKVNSMKKEARLKEYSKFEKQFKKAEEEKKNEKKELPELPDAEIGKVVTRLAPEPSKYNHLGHALSFLLNYVYANKYKGKCKLRFEDTNPEKVSQEYVDAMMSDVIDYLGIKVEGIKYVSDDMKILYDYAEKLIEMEEAYMCFCKRETLKKLREEGKECPCREIEKEENKKEWKKFLAGKYMKGQACLRLKGDMTDNNYVMRDPVLFRAVKEPHYRHKDKYKIWPMYDFYNPIEDSLMQVTHILRSNEFEPRVELQDYIKKLLNLKEQTIVQYGRFNVIGTTTKGREIRELVESGEYTGWDDIRLATLRTLKRRGIVKEAFYELVQQVGLSKYQVNLDFNMIASVNRKLIDSSSDRYFFVASPIKLKINKFPKIKEIEVKIHPEKDKKRKVKIQDLYISEEDYEKNIGKEIRLMHLFNLKLNAEHNAEFTGMENKDIPKIHWNSNFVKARVLMPDGKWKDGIAEEAVSKLKIGTIIQFERFGFVRLDNINSAGEYEFWFTHR
ncbi:glutamate--tRNA ligase [Candidatus Pacearchaeota archaeon]|nr:glutamate--tRNA ligase [Candidatus Pacearchaeota archaeon]